MAGYLEMTTGSVLGILIFVFYRYMLVDMTAVPQREHLARDLERAGFARSKVERALDWLTDLAFRQERAAAMAQAGAQPQGVRVFTDGELVRLSAGGRGVALAPARAQAL